MNISDEAVEAAVRSVIDALQSDETGWVLADAPNEVTIDVNAFDLASALRRALESAAPYMLKDMRPMTLVEIAQRDRPEAMEEARQKVMQDRREGRRNMIRAAKAEAWDEGRESVDFDSCGLNPYRTQRG